MTDLIKVIMNDMYNIPLAYEGDYKFVEDVLRKHLNHTTPCELPIHIAIDEGKVGGDKTCRLYYTRDDRGVITVKDVIYSESKVEVSKQEKIKKLSNWKGKDKTKTKINEIINILNNI